MAKIGEGDQRWIVSERQDGKNVGNWHWSETNCLNHAKEGLKEKLVGLEVVSNVQITDLTKCEGDCYTYNRKGTMYLFYDMQLTLAWKGDGPYESIDGTVELPNVSDDLDTEDLEVSVTCKGTAPQADAVKQSLRSEGKHAIKAVIVSFLDDLKSRITAKQPPTVSSKSASPAAPTTSSSSTTKPASTSAPSKADTGKLEFSLGLECDRGAVFDALTNPLRIAGYTRAPSNVDLRVGGLFEIYSGAIKGEYVEIVPGELLVMTWRMNDWESDSLARVELSGERNTHITVKHTGIPKQDKFGNDVLPQVEQGWKVNLFQRMRQAFGWAETAA